MTNIKILVLDVDGTLTDGKIYVSSQGEIMKAFNVKDGLGINFAPIRYGADNYDDEKVLNPPEGEEFDSFE